MHWIYAHLIGDYLIQTDWMAVNKKRSSWVCATHVVTYLLPFVFCGLRWNQLLAIGIQHFGQDRTQVVKILMDTTGHKRFAQAPLAPWSIILTDNILHILFISWVAGI